MNLKQLIFKIVQGVEQKSLKKKELELLAPLFKQRILKNSLHLKFSSDYKIGKIDKPKSGKFGFLVQSSKEKDLLIQSHDLNGAENGDIVVVKRDFKSRGRPKAKVVYIVVKKHPIKLAYLTKYKNNIVAYSLNDESKITLKVKQKALRELPQFTVVKIDMISYNIIDILGVLSDPLVDEKISLGIDNRTEEFPKNIKIELKSLGNSVDKSLYPNYKDLTHLPFVTIDPITAKDFDDAIYYDKKQNTIFVAIADVTAYVYPYSLIDAEARKRGFSIYFPHKSIPMLPRELSENLCSLKENVDRLAFIFKIVLNGDNKIKNYSLFNGIIRSKKRFSYDRVDELLNNKSPELNEKEVVGFIRALASTTQAIRAKRLEKGFDFNSDEVRLNLDKNLDLISTEIEEQTISHQLVEECMLLANQCAATYFKDGIFRTHDKPSFKSIQKLIDQLYEIGLNPAQTSNIHILIESIQDDAKKLNLKSAIDTLLIRALKKAEYSYQNIGHFGLGFEHYTHFTSPIRRYSDLVLHRLLKSIINSDQKTENYLKSQLPEICNEVTNLEQVTTRIMWDYDDRVYARWAQKHLGEVFDAIIVDIHPTKPPIVKIVDKIKGARIFLEKNNNNYKLFEEIKIKIIGSNIATKKIYGEVFTFSD